WILAVQAAIEVDLSLQRAIQQNEIGNGRIVAPKCGKPGRQFERELCGSPSRGEIGIRAVQQRGDIGENRSLALYVRYYVLIVAASKDSGFNCVCERVHGSAVLCQSTRGDKLQRRYCKRS